ncbi:uncharacterized protein LOC141601516 [Silene latifolia]|uniref:uncharacterized protein LOC141601516 n=1 Tax=Silene latifolia TaxID=37657 RepID=UPI003D778169
MKADSAEYTRKCDACQRSAPIIHQPAEPLHPIIFLWLFMTWGMDIIGPLPRAPGNRLWMLAMTDYFSKWIEAEAFTEVKISKSFLIPNVTSSSGELNSAEMIRSLDTVDELQASVKIRLATYKQSVTKSYNKNVKVRLLEVGDLVLRELPGSMVALEPPEIALG